MGFLQLSANSRRSQAKLLALQNCICTREIGSKVMHVEVSEWWRQPRFLEVGLFGDDVLKDLDVFQKEMRFKIMKVIWHKILDC